MTDQAPIPDAPRRRLNSKAASLFERADTAFGLDNLGAQPVPTALPKRENRAPERRVHPAAERIDRSAPSPAAEPSSAVVKVAEARVDLCGPHYDIDRDTLRASGLIVPEDPVTGLLEEFRIIKRELLAEARASSDPSSRLILITSPHAGEGKTFCAANLALAMSAERDVEVLLVDADLINPSITGHFGIGSAPGFMDALVDPDCRPEELALRTDIERLFIMPAGTSSARDAEYLASARTAQVLERFIRGAPNRFVIFDTPPALAASPAAELAGYAGQALMVVRADETSRAAIEDAQQLLSACPSLKLLLNAAQFSPSGRRFGDYGKDER